MERKFGYPIKTRYNSIGHCHLGFYNYSACWHLCPCNEEEGGRFLMDTTKIYPLFSKMKLYASVDTKIEDGSRRAGYSSRCQEYWRRWLSRWAVKVSIVQ